MTIDDSSQVSLAAAPDTMAPLVRLTGVSKRFGSLKALDNVDLDIHRKDVLAVVGPSGSGKSTLCRTLNRLEPVDEGLITFEGVAIPQDGRQLARFRTKVGMVFQDFNLFAHMTVLENLTLGLTKAKGQKRAEAEERSHEALKKVGVADQALKYPRQMSGGQQQRAAIARALVMEPKLMLFDEPTSALDPEMVKEVLDIMLELADSGMTMVVVTHEMGFAKSAATQILFMDHGRVVERATPQSFFSSPETARAKDFLSRILHS